MGKSYRIRTKVGADENISIQLDQDFEQIEISSNSSIIGKKIVDLAFPKTAVITLIKRENKYLTPSGATIIKEKDLLNVISSNENEMEKIKSILN